MEKQNFDEAQNVEWKESWRDEYLKWICGFANATGGKLCIGVDDLSPTALARFRKEASRSGRVDVEVLNDTDEHLLQDLQLLDEDTGQLPENWTTEKLLESHPSSPHNPKIANAFFRSGDIESWGRGYKRILDAVIERKLLPPMLEMVSGLMVSYYVDVRSQLQTPGMADRLIAVVQFAVENGSVTNSDVQRLLNTNRTTAYRILQQLGGWLDIHGVTGKSTYYTVKGFQNTTQTLH